MLSLPAGDVSGRNRPEPRQPNNQTTDNLYYDATFQSYLKAADYQTGLVDQVPPRLGQRRPSPFFDYWALTQGGYLNVPWGTGEGKLTGDYTTTETRRQALRILDNFERNEAEPFVLYVGTQAPHGAGSPSRSTPTPTSVQRRRRIRTNQLRTVKSVDDMVDRVMARLETLGQGSNTPAVFTSGNGSQWREHGFVSEYRPYNQCVSVPFSGPLAGAGPGGFVDLRFVSNVDILPSKLSAAAALRHPLDGRRRRSNPNAVPTLRSFRIHPELFQLACRDDLTRGVPHMIIRESPLQKTTGQGRRFVSFCRRPR